MPKFIDPKVQQYISKLTDNFYSIKADLESDVYQQQIRGDQILLELNHLQHRVKMLEEELKASLMDNIEEKNQVEIKKQTSSVIFAKGELYNRKNNTFETN